MDTVYPGKPDDEFSDGTQPGRFDEESRVFATLANAFLEGDYVATTQEIPQRLDHYRILEKLGSGGMSDVWLAEHIYLKQRVAIKTLRNSMSSGNDLENVKCSQKIEWCSVFQGPPPPSARPPSWPAASPACASCAR